MKLPTLAGRKRAHRRDLQLKSHFIWTENQGRKRESIADFRIAFRPRMHLCPSRAPGPAGLGHRAAPQSSQRGPGHSMMGANASAETLPASAPMSARAWAAEARTVGCGSYEALGQAIRAQVARESKEPASRSLATAAPVSVLGNDPKARQEASTTAGDASWSAQVIQEGPVSCWKT